LASATAAAARIWIDGDKPIFPMSDTALVGIGGSLPVYLVLGLVVGVISVLVTKIVYAVEDRFERLPMHWMWWPAIGAVAVGVVGYFAPHTLGVGYDNISRLLSGDVLISAAAFLCTMKFVSWCISLGSGTSGGTLAPLLTIGGGLGIVLGHLAHWLVPVAHVDLRLAALVGMMSMFAGASRAVMASIVFGLEITMQPLALLPLLGGCVASYIVSCYLMPQTIMTEKIARRGVRPPHEYAADVLDQMLVRDVATNKLVTVQHDATLLTIRTWLSRRTADTLHQGFPVLDGQGRLRGIVTRKDLEDASHPETRRIEELLRRTPVVVYDDCSLREAVDHMLNHDVGRLPVMRRGSPSALVGIITRGDILGAFRKRMEETVREKANVQLWRDKKLSASSR
jgi:CBS domain-containing protein